MSTTAVSSSYNIIMNFSNIFKDVEIIQITENEFVPAFMIVESPDESPKSYLFAPERDFNEIDEGIDIIKEHFGK